MGSDYILQSNGFRFIYSLPAGPIEERKVYHQLAICGVCGQGSYDPGFLPGKYENPEGWMSQICQECVDTMEARRGTYELRKEIKNPTKKVK